MRPLAFIIGLIGAAILPYECSAQVLDNPFSEYIQREVTMTPGGGNANDTNAAIHTINPWPPYAFDTRIPDLGRHAVGAIDRMYQNPNPFTQQQQGAGAAGSSTAAGATAGAAAAGATMGTTGTPSGY